MLEVRPWYVRRAKQEGCLCKHCENFKCYQETLHSLVTVVASQSVGQPVSWPVSCMYIQPSRGDADDPMGSGDLHKHQRRVRAIRGSQEPLLVLAFISVLPEFISVPPNPPASPWSDRKGARGDLLGPSLSSSHASSKSNCASFDMERGSL